MYEFTAQPNMIFELPNHWKTNDDYVAAFSKKYRDQYKRALKKSDCLIVKELSLEEIISNEERIYQLYYYVAKNAPFNTFFLDKKHFSTFKKQCGNRFILCGYFIEERKKAGGETEGKRRGQTTTPNAYFLRPVMRHHSSFSTTGSSAKRSA